MANIFYSFALLLAIVTKGSALICACTQNNRVLSYCTSEYSCTANNCGTGYYGMCATFNGFYGSQSVSEMGCFCASTTKDDVCYAYSYGGNSGTMCICDDYNYCNPPTVSTSTTRTTGAPGQLKCQCTINNLFLSTKTSCYGGTCNIGGCASDETAACMSFDLTTDGSRIHERGCGCRSRTSQNTKCDTVYASGNINGYSGDASRVSAQQCYCFGSNCNNQYNGANANRSVYAVMMLAFAWCMLTMT